MRAITFDIETVPDIKTGRKLHNLGEHIPDDDVARAMEHIQMQKTNRSFLPLHLHRIVAISMLYIADEEIKMTTLSGDESDIVQNFFNYIAHGSAPTLVSWNGGGFDLPVLHYRALLHKVSAPRYWDNGNIDREFRYSNYLTRYHWRHIDLMDKLANYNMRSNAPLDGVAKMLNLPGKQGIGGAEVWSAFIQGKQQEICDYCEIDVLNTFLIFLRFQLMRGVLSSADEQKHRELLCAYLTQENRPHFNNYLAEWQKLEAE